MEYQQRQMKQDMAIEITNISQKTYILRDDEIIKILQLKRDNFCYKYIPAVFYNSRTANTNSLSIPQVKAFNNGAPFSLYEIGTPISILRNYMSNKIDKDDLLSVKRAFKGLKNFASRCYERVIADLCCQVILERVTHLTTDKELVFFIEKSASDKMLGRLATLNLNLNNLTICFLVYNPSDLMTSVMSNQTGKLHFDIHRLMNSDISDYIGPYPGDSEESLVQTYFYKPSDYRPMRVDIFAQGLLRDKIEAKKEIVKKILNPDSKDSIHHPGVPDPKLLIPYGLWELEDYINKHDPDFDRKLIEVGE